MEATFRPVKDWHRNRSNHRGTRDLEILRAVALSSRLYMQAAPACIRKHIVVLIGVLCRSGRSFKLANRILGNQPRSACDSGHTVRARSVVGDTTFPMWHNVEDFYDCLLSWACQQCCFGGRIRLCVVGRARDLILFNPHCLV